jgi:acetoin utilization deacetylase AcuC-like enzyme
MDGVVEEDAVRTLAGQLFSWVCQNCTNTVAFADPSEPMLDYSRAALKRLAAQRAVLIAARETHEEATAAWYTQATAVGDGVFAHPAGLPQPSTPSHAAVMAAAVPPLPSVPSPPSLAEGQGRALQCSQRCASCGAPFLDPPPASSAISRGVAPGDADEGWRSALEARPQLMALTLRHSIVGGVPEDVEGEAGEASPARLTAASAAASAAFSTHLSTLGLDAAFLDRILSAPSCNARGRRAAEAEGASAPAQGGTEALVSMRADLRAPAPLAKSLESGWGGFAPLAGYVYDARMLLHEEGVRPAGKRVPPVNLYGAPTPPTATPPHPERPDRLRAIAGHLAATGLLQRCVRIGAREVRPEEVQLVHSERLVGVVGSLRAAVEEAGGAGTLDGGDTFACEHTALAASLAAGSLLELTEAVMRGTVDRGVALVRPPGHHAEPDAAQGFCLYNNVAVAAAAALSTWGARRVLIVDWDVHHGNGTEAAFYDDPRVLFISLHRHDGGDFYPGTGGAGRVGAGAGSGYNINIPWEGGGYGDAEYLHAFEEIVMPVATAFNPDLVLVSSGFDAARGDPLGGCDLTPAGYGAMAHRLLSLAQGRVVVALEGGYNLTSIATGMEAVLRVLMGAPPLPLMPPVPRALHEREGEGEGESARLAVDPIDAAAHAEEERAAAEVWGGLERDTILSLLAPKSRAFGTIVRVLAAHAPFWPVLGRKYRAAQAHADALTAARAAKEAAARAAEGAASGGSASGASLPPPPSVLAALVRGGVPPLPVPRASAADEEERQYPGGEEEEEGEGGEGTEEEEEEEDSEGDLLDVEGVQEVLRGGAGSQELPPERAGGEEEGEEEDEEEEAEEEESGPGAKRPRTEDW